MIAAAFAALLSLVDAAPAPSADLPLPKAGQFGLGLNLEGTLGWNQVSAPGGSPPGAVAALALQIDMGPHAAFRLPLSFAFAGGGNEIFGQLAFTPGLLYRFRRSVEQELVPYLGLGLKLGVLVGGRGLLGRPITGMRTSDACSQRRAQGARIDDCAFTFSPEPMVGLEWHTSRIFSLDFSAAYSFARLTSEEQIVSWVHVFQVVTGPRLSF